MKITKYNVINKFLDKFINYYWIIDLKDQFIYHKLLPVCNFDLIFNFSSPIKYISENELTPDCIHLNGIKTGHVWIKQNGNINIIGISFRPTGIYPFLKIPLYELINKTVEFYLLNKKINHELYEKLKTSKSVINKIEIIEKSLLNYLDNNFFNNEIFNIFNIFISNIDNLTINQFCHKYGIHIRRLERMFKNYIGITPKMFVKIRRFGKSLKQIIKKEYNIMTDIAYKNNYFDQMHFIKEFKEFTGCSPVQFIAQKKSIKENIIF